MTVLSYPLPKRVVALAALAAAIATGCGQAQKQSTPDVGAPEAQLSKPTWIGPARQFAREVDATADAKGGLWSVFLSSKAPKDSKVEQVDLVLRHVDANGTRQELTLTRGEALASPTIARFDGGVFVAWEDHLSTNASLQGIPIRRNAENKLELISQPTDLGASPSARLPDLTTLPGGGIALVWQALGELDSYDVFLSTKDEPGAPWSSPLPLTNNASDEWCPKIVATGTGGEQVLHVAFDRFTPGSANGFDIVYVGVRVRADTHDHNIAETLVATGPNYQGYPSIAADTFAKSASGSSEVWIAYEEAPQFGEFGPLRTRRTTRLAKVTTSQNQTTVAHATLPLSVTDMQRGDFPQVEIGAGGLVLSRRVPNSDYQARNAARNSFYATWRTRITTFLPDGSGNDYELPDSDGDNLNDSALTACLGESGEVRVVFTADSRSQTFASKWGFDTAIEGSWRLAFIAIPRPNLQARSFPIVSVGTANPAHTTQSAGPMGLALAARSKDVFYGDLHRHTHLSRCAGGQDGTFLDAVRYARGPGALDFLAVTDHFQHLTPASWWRSRRNAERWNAKGSLVVFPGIERNVSDEGHQNLIWPSAEIASLAARDARPPVFPQAQVIAIPHMSSLSDNAFDWEALDTERHRLIEVHQGRRGSYEGIGLPHSAEDNSSAAGQVKRLPEVLSLSPDIRLPGLISSSDHGASSNGYAGVYLPVPERELRLPSRQTMFRALHDANTFATTGPPPSLRNTPKRLHLESRAEGLQVSASSLGLAYIEILRDGELIERLDAAGNKEIKDAGDVARVLLTFRLRNRSGEALMIQVKKPTPEGQESPELISRVHLRRRLADEIKASRIGPSQLQITFPTTGRADVDLTLDIHASTGATLEFSYQDTQALWSADDAVTGQAQRLLLGQKAGRPQVDITRIGFDLDAVSPTPGKDGSELFEKTYVPPQGWPNSVYYARAVWQDGNMAWSSMVRVTD